MSVKRVYTFPYKTHIQIAQDYAEDRLCRKKPSISLQTSELVGKTVLAVPYPDAENQGISAFNMETRKYGTGFCQVIGSDEDTVITPVSDSLKQNIIHPVLNPYPFSLPLHDPEYSGDDIGLKTWNTICFQVYSSYRGEYIIGNLYSPPKLNGFVSEDVGELQADTEYPIILAVPYLGSSIINAVPDWTMQGLSVSQSDKVTLEYSLEKRKWFFFSRKRGGTSDFVSINTSHLWKWQGEYKGRAVVFEGDDYFTVKIKETFPAQKTYGQYRFQSISTDGHCRVFVLAQSGWISPDFAVLNGKVPFAVTPDHLFGGTISGTFSLTPRAEFDGWGAYESYIHPTFLSGLPDKSVQSGTALVELYSNNILTATGTLDLSNGSRTDLVLSEKHGRYPAGDTVSLYYDRNIYPIENGRFSVNNTEYLFGIPCWKIDNEVFSASLEDDKMQWYGCGEITIDGIQYADFHFRDNDKWVIGKYLDPVNGWYQVGYSGFDLFGTTVFEHYTLAGKSEDKEPLTMVFSELYDNYLPDYKWQVSIERCQDDGTI